VFDMVHNLILWTLAISEEGMGRCERPVVR
jgi:hypothetical protein